MKYDRERLLGTLTTLITTPATRAWERQLLVGAKDALTNGGRPDSVVAKLEGELRPLALRNNLTPDLTDFYRRVTGDEAGAAHFDLDRYNADDAPYEDRAIFAGGCFWCMVEPFDTRPGIEAVVSGYTGGTVEQPTYEQVSGGYTGHVEAVEIIFDTRKITYAELVDIYWQLIDPTDDMGQMGDRGENYRPVIFVRNDAQRAEAEASKQRVINSGMYAAPIVVGVEAATTFWPAENFHQDFYKKNARRYKHIERERQQFLRFQHLRGRLHRLFRK